MNHAWAIWIIVAIAALMLLIVAWQAGPF